MAAGYNGRGFDAGYRFRLMFPKNGLPPWCFFERSELNDKAIETPCIKVSP